MKIHFFQVWKRPIEGASSADGEIKKWSLDSEVIELQTSRTLMAHEQEINSISVSLDNQFVATASQVKKCLLLSTLRMKNVNVEGGSWSK
jgi:WD40 repeat protein